jgi:hypothetical protein
MFAVWIASASERMTSFDDSGSRLSLVRGFGSCAASVLATMICWPTMSRTCWPESTTTGDLDWTVLARMPIDVPVPAAECRLTSGARPDACAKPSAIAITLPSCRPMM